MVARTWVGASGAAWTTSSSWSPAAVPTTSDDLTINSSNITINITSGNARHVYVNGSNVTFAIGTSVLNVNGDLNVAGSLTTTGTSTGINFTGTAQASNWTPGGGQYARVTCAKSSQSLNLLGTANIEQYASGLFTFTSGTFNQNGYNINCKLVTNTSVTSRTWNMGSGNVYCNGTGTVYAQNTSTCTFGGTRGWIVPAVTSTISGGTNATSSPSLLVNAYITVTVSASGVYDLDLRGVMGTGTVTCWNSFIDNAISGDSTSANLSMARASGGTYTYSSYHRWSTLTFGGTGVACTWNVSASRSNSITLGSVSGCTYNLNDCEISTNNTSGAINCTGASSTYNFNNVYSYQGTSTQISLSGGTSSTYNLSSGAGETTMNGSITHSSGTVNVGNDVRCRSWTSSGTVNKTINFSDSWIRVGNTSGVSGVITIADPGYFFTDMSSTSTGGFITQSATSSAHSFSTVARAHAPRIRLESSANTLSGNVRELIIQDGCGISGSSVVTLMVGDVVDEGSVAGLASLDINLAQAGGYTWDSKDRFGGGFFDVLTVDSQADAGVEYSMRANCTGVGNNKTGAICRFADMVCNGASSLGTAGSTYHFDIFTGTTITTTQLSLVAGSTSTYNLDQVNLNGSINHTGGTLNLVGYYTDINCRSYSASALVNKTINFNGLYINVGMTAGVTGSVSIADPAYFFTDMSTNSQWDGGFRLNSTTATSTHAFSTVPRAHAPRVIWNSNVGSMTGNVRELIINDNCGPSSSSTVTLMVGDIIINGPGGVSTNLAVELGHDYWYTFNYIADYYNTGRTFKSISVNTQYTATDASFNCGVVDVNTSKGSISYHFDEVIMSGAMSLSTANNTYNLNNVIGNTTTTTQVSFVGGSTSTYNVDYVSLTGSVNFTGGTLNIGGNYPLEIRSFSTSALVNRYVNASNWIIINDRGASTGSVSIADQTYFFPMWYGYGFKLKNTGAVSIGALRTDYEFPNIIVEAASGSTASCPSSLLGRINNLTFDGAYGGSLAGITNIYGNVTGNVGGQIASADFTFEGGANHTCSATSNSGPLYIDSLVVNTGSVTFSSGIDCSTFAMTSGTAYINENSTVRTISSTSGLSHTGGTIEIAATKTLYVYSYLRTGTNGCSLVLNGNMECPSSTSTSTRWSCPDTTNFSVSGNGWIIYRGAGQFNYAQTNSSAINFTTGANTFNLQILQNISSTSTGFLYLPAVKSFKNNTGYPFDQMGRWAANTTSFDVYVFGDLSLYAPPNDDGTYRNKIQLVRPRFAGTDPNTIHNMGDAGINWGWGGMDPTFDTIRMNSAGKLRCIHAVNSGSTFNHNAGTVELYSCNVNCTAVWLSESGTWDSGTRAWEFPSPNRYFVPSINFSHPDLSALTCSGTYYNHHDPALLSGVYINYTGGALNSGSTNRSNTPPNFIFGNGTQQLPANFYCGSIKCYTSNVPANAVIYVYGMWAPTDNGAWNTGISINMQGTGNGFIDTTGSLYSPPIEIVNPGTGTKTVYTSAMQRTTRILNITVNQNTILSGLHASGQGYPVDISGQLVLYGTLQIKANQEYTFSGSGTVLSAGTAQGYTDGGGTIYFSNSAATSANLPPSATINNIVRNTTSVNTLTLTSNNTAITTIANSASGGGSFAFVNGGTGAPTFSNFNIDGIVTAQTYITGPVISGGSTFTVDYATITNSTASASGKWIAGTGTVDGGGNSGWTFGAPPPVSSNADKFFLVMA